MAGDAHFYTAATIQSNRLAQPCTTESGDCVVEISELEGYVRHMERSGQSAPGFLFSAEGSETSSIIGPERLVQSLSDPGSRPPWHMPMGLDGPDSAIMVRDDSESSEAANTSTSLYATSEGVRRKIHGDYEGDDVSQTSTVAGDQSTTAFGKAEASTAASFDRKLTTWIKSLRNALRQRFSVS